MVRETVGTGTAAGAVVDDVATVVVVTVCVVVTDDGADVGVCADMQAAVAMKVKARDSFFTVFSRSEGD